MKKIHLVLMFFSIALPSFSQDLLQVPANTQVDARIVEVFGDQLQQLVMKDAHRLQGLNDILFKRHEIIEVAATADEKYPKLSTVPLFNNYNPDLKRDVVFNKDTFNILKYDMRFFASSDILYRVDNTDFLIVIHPQNLRK